MRIVKSLSNAERFIASRRQVARVQGRGEEVRLWMYVREAYFFVLTTGQVYQFEDYLTALAPGEPLQASEALRTGGSSLARSSVELLLNVLSEPLAATDRRHVLVLGALLNFIADTGQGEEMEDFFANPQAYRCLAIRYFATQAEAEHWLNTAADLPSPAHILVGDQYWQIMYDRERDTRGMYRDIANEPRVEYFAGRGIPAGAPTFKTRAEAEEWLNGPPAMSEVFVRIAGEYYLASYQKRLKRHTLQHVETALREWEEYKREVERRRAQEAANPSAHGDEEEPDSD